MSFAQWGWISRPSGRRLQRVKARFLSPAQLEKVVTPAQLLEAWTIKEALYKALLTPGLALADIDLHDPRWEVTTCYPAENVTMTLAVEKNRADLKQ